MEIPLLPVGNFTRTEQLSHEAQTMMQALLTALSLGIGMSGFQITKLTNAQMIQIQDAEDENNQKTCEYGTMVFDTTNNKLMVAKESGGIPIFKEVVTL